MKIVNTLIASLIVLISCRSASPPQIPAGHLLVAYHSFGGPVGITEVLAVYPNRDVVFRSTSWRVTRGRISSSDLVRLHSILADADFERQLANVQSLDVGDRENVSFQIGDKTYTLVCPTVIRAQRVAELVDVVRQVARPYDRSFLGKCAESQ